MIATSLIKVSRASTDHASDIGRVGKASFENAFGHLFLSQQELQEYLRFTYDPVKLFLSIRKRDNIFFIAENENEVIGFAKMKLHSLHPQLNSFVQSELQKIYVLPGFHGSGAGQQLLNAVLEQASLINPDHLWLDTHISNLKGIRFYERNGFTKYGKHFFKIGTQEFEYDLMVKRIAV